jgi:FlaA1/EpsC-like NDP-sugar epimerase
MARTDHCSYKTLADSVLLFLGCVITIEFLLNMATRRSVFVTGGNGYIGAAICRTFVRAGWRVFGLVRRPEAALELASDEVIPIVGNAEAVT